MNISIFIIILSVANLVVLMLGTQFLSKHMESMLDTQNRRLELISKLVDSSEAMCDVLKAFQKEDARTNDALQEIWKRLEVLSEVKNNVDVLLKKDPTGHIPEQEVAMSKSVEDGIASIMAYTAGKVPGVEIRL